MVYILIGSVSPVISKLQSGINQPQGGTCDALLSRANLALFSDNVAEVSHCISLKYSFIDLKFLLGPGSEMLSLNTQFNHKKSLKV